MAYVSTTSFSVNVHADAHGFFKGNVSKHTNIFFGNKTKCLYTISLISLLSTSLIYSPTTVSIDLKKKLQNEAEMEYLRQSKWYFYDGRRSCP